MVRRIAGIAAAGAALALAGGTWLVTASGSPGGVRVPVVPPAAVRSGTPPPPPRGALVLARGHGHLAVALAAQRAGAGIRLTATIVAPDGTGVRGLDVRFAVSGRELPRATPCGAGCYRSAFRSPASPRRVAIVLSGTKRARATVAFALPPHWPVSAAPLLRAAERAFASLRSTVYRERLSSGPRVTNTSVWRSEAPDRLSYRTASGNAGIVIGHTRWDLVVGGGWQRGSQNPPLSLPAPSWGRNAYDVMLLGGGRSQGRAVVRIAFFDPGAFAWYRVTLERATLRTLVVDMTAAAHFMQDRYVSFDVPRTIRPPVPGPS